MEPNVNHPFHLASGSDPENMGKSNGKRQKESIAASQWYLLATTLLALFPKPCLKGLGELENQARQKSEFQQLAAPINLAKGSTPKHWKT